MSRRGDATARNSHAAPDTLGHSLEWQASAACRTTDNPELFFPRGTTGEWLLEIEEAKAICYGCPALEACFLWALTNREEHGIWGATTVAERRKILRRRGVRIAAGPDLDDEDSAPEPTGT